MLKTEVNYLWILFWLVVGLGWSYLSFFWLRRSVEKIPTPTADKKTNLGSLVLRRVFLFFGLAVLFYLAVKTEPIAAVVLAVSITISTWLQVLLYHKKLKKEEKNKEEELGHN
jgi:dipeptide/tripeptide permease